VAHLDQLWQVGEEGVLVDSVQPLQLGAAGRLGGGLHAAEGPGEGALSGKGVLAGEQGALPPVRGQALGLQFGHRRVYAAVHCVHTLRTVHCFSHAEKISSTHGSVSFANSQVDLCRLCHNRSGVVEGRG